LPLDITTVVLRYSKLAKKRVLAKHQHK
jgi:hypothetical protein